MCKKIKFTFVINFFDKCFFKRLVEKYNTFSEDSKILFKKYKNTKIYYNKIFIMFCFFF